MSSSGPIAHTTLEQLNQRLAELRLERNKLIEQVQRANKESSNSTSSFMGLARLEDLQNQNADEIDECLRMRRRLYSGQDAQDQRNKIDFLTNETHLAWRVVTFEGRLSYCSFNCFEPPIFQQIVQAFNNATKGKGHYIAPDQETSLIRSLCSKQASNQFHLVLSDYFVNLLYASSTNVLLCPIYLTTIKKIVTEKLPTLSVENKQSFLSSQTQILWERGFCDEMTGYLGPRLKKNNARRVKEALTKAVNDRSITDDAIKVVASRQQPNRFRVFLAETMVEQMVQASWAQGSYQDLANDIQQAIKRKTRAKPQL